MKAINNFASASSPARRTSKCCVPEIGGLGRVVTIGSSASDCRGLQFQGAWKQNVVFEMHVQMQVFFELL